MQPTDARACTTPVTAARPNAPAAVDLLEIARQRRAEHLGSLLQEWPVLRVGNRIVLLTVAAALSSAAIAIAHTIFPIRANHHVEIARSDIGPAARSTPERAAFR